MGTFEGKVVVIDSEKISNEKCGGPSTIQEDAMVISDQLLLHRLFELQVMKTPTIAALQWERQAPMTYDELNKASNRLARYLVSMN